MATQSRKCFQTHGRRSGVGLKAVVNVTVTVTASVEGLRLPLPDIGSIRVASHATYKCLQLFYATINPKYGTVTVTHETLHDGKSRLYVRTDSLKCLKF